jgi:hypothetical protein
MNDDDVTYMPFTDVDQEASVMAAEADLRRALDTGEHQWAAFMAFKMDDPNASLAMHPDNIFGPILVSCAVCDSYDPADAELPCPGIRKGA